MGGARREGSRGVGSGQKALLYALAPRWLQSRKQSYEIHHSEYKFLLRKGAVAAGVNAVLRTIY